MVRSRSAWSGVALMCAAGLACAQPRTPALDGMLDQLNSDSFVQREAATEALVAATNIDNVDLVRELRSDRLDAEASSRVLEVLRKRFFASPRAAVGISFPNWRVSDAQAARGVRVEHVYDSMPAGRMGILRVGDEIIEIEGQSLQNRLNPNGAQLLMAVVFSRVPGESVNMKIRRPQQPPLLDGADNLALDPGGATTILDVEVPLGSYPQVQEAYHAREAEAQQKLQQEQAQPAQQRLEPGLPAQQVVFQPGMRAPEISMEELTNAWRVFLHRSGLGTSGAHLTPSDAREVDWSGQQLGVVTARNRLRSIGRVLVGPIDLANTNPSLMRDQVDHDRNLRILRNLAARDGEAIRVDQLERNPNPRIVRFGNGQNGEEFRVLGFVNNERNTAGRPRLNRIPEERFQSICQDLASGIAEIESELRRLSVQRDHAGDDISTIQIVDERIAELRAEWAALRAQAEEFAAATQPHPLTEPSSFQ